MFSSKNPEQFKETMPPGFSPDAQALCWIDVIEAEYQTCPPSLAPELPTQWGSKHIVDNAKNKTRKKSEYPDGPISIWIKLSN